MRWINNRGKYITHKFTVVLSTSNSLSSLVNKHGHMGNYNKNLKKIKLKRSFKLK